MIEINSKISIIVPCYNGEKFLKRNLDSIKNLSNLNEIELTIIDNNSMDLSTKIIESYKKDIRIKLIKQDSNLGFAKACNIGVSKAQSEFIFITNVDVIFSANFFKKLKRIYKTYKQDGEIIISPAIIFEGDGIHYFGAKNHFLCFSYTKEISQKLPQKKIIKRTNRFSGGALFIKKSLFIELGGFDSRFFIYYEDTDLSLRIQRYGIKIYTTNDPYLIHQKHELTFNDFRYYLLERNRFLTFCKNVNSFKKLIPYFILSEIILLSHSILIRKFKLRIRIYYELLTRIKFLKNMRKKSKKKVALLPYQILSKTLDPILMRNLQNIKVFNRLLNLLNFILKLS